MSVSQVILTRNEINEAMNQGFFEAEIDGTMREIPLKFLFEPSGDYQKYLKKKEKKFLKKEKKKKESLLTFNVEELF